MSWKRDAASASNVAPTENVVDLPTIAQEKPVFRNAADLHHYLLSLRDVLVARGIHELAAPVETAAKYAGGLSTSELFGETAQALKIVTQNAGAILEQPELASVQHVIRFIDEAFRRANSGR